MSAAVLTSGIERSDDHRRGYQLPLLRHARRSPVKEPSSRTWLRRSATGLWHSSLMEHYWQDLPLEVDGRHWFAGVDIYSEQVRRAQDGAVFVELGAWKGRSTSFMGVEIHNSNKRIKFYAVDHWRGSDETAHCEDPDVRAERLFEAFEGNIAPV